MIHMSFLEETFPIEKRKGEQIGRKGKERRREQTISWTSRETLPLPPPNHTQLAQQPNPSHKNLHHKPRTPTLHLLIYLHMQFWSLSIWRAPVAFKAELLFGKTDSCFVHKTKPKLNITSYVAKLYSCWGGESGQQHNRVRVYAIHMDRVLHGTL